MIVVVIINYSTTIPCSSFSPPPAMMPADTPTTSAHQAKNFRIVHLEGMYFLSATFFNEFGMDTASSEFSVNASIFEKSLLQIFYCLASSLIIRRNVRDMQPSIQSKRIFLIVLFNIEASIVEMGY